MWEKMLSAEPRQGGSRKGATEKRGFLYPNQINRASSTAHRFRVASAE